MNYIFSDKNDFSRRASERNGCRNHFLSDRWNLTQNEQSVKGILIGSEASPKRDLGTQPVHCSPPVRHMCKRTRIFISLLYLFGSTTQAIINFMPQDRLGPNALCVLEGRNQICTYIYIAYSLPVHCLLNAFVHDMGQAHVMGDPWDPRSSLGLGPAPMGRAWHVLGPCHEHRR